MAQRLRLDWAQVTPPATFGFERMFDWRPAVHFQASRRQLSLLATAAVLTIVLLSAWHNQEQVERALSAAFHPFADLDPHSGWPRCRSLAGADDVLVVMKTGANEVEDKLAVHLRTTLKCYPHQVIFSDYEEDLATGQHLYDAFKCTSRSIKETHEDFDLWRKLQGDGRAGLLPSELSGTDSREKPEAERKQIPGWQLDKWKFLPMVNQTLHLYPDKHWYVFVETDTYLLWSNLLPYLAARSWTDDHYIGSEASIENVAFAHGGSGFVLSRPALEKVANLFNNNQAEWELFTDEYWVGDHILAAALREAGVLLQDGQPTWQGKPLGLLSFGPDDGLWCSTAMTYHHQMPVEIEDMWGFEQTWISQIPQSTNVTQSNSLRHRDVFEKYVLPRIRQPRSAWNNHADPARTSSVSSLLECEALCEADTSCLQYSLHDNGHCRVMSKVIFGEASEGVESGWMLERIQNYFNEAETCEVTHSI